MAFLKKALKWLSPGVEPSEEKKQQGFQNGEFPSAGHFDFMFKSTADAIEELQQKAGEVKTVNGQLPNASGNIDVSIDTNLLATKAELTTHKLDLASTVAGKGASLIGLNDASTVFTATNVEGAMTELFTSASNGKIAIANAITGKGQTASGSDTFTQLASAISGISTGKKWREGSVTSSSIETIYSTSNGNSYFYEFFLNITDFVPSLVIFFNAEGTESIIYDTFGIVKYQGTIRKIQVRNGVSIFLTQQRTTNYYPTSSPNKEYRFLAFE